MGDMGDVFREMRAQRTEKRRANFNAAYADLEYAADEAAKLDLYITVSNGGHHWRFMHKKKMVMSFWPASNKACYDDNEVFRCKSWKTALNKIKKDFR